MNNTDIHLSLLRRVYDAGLNYTMPPKTLGVVECMLGTPCESRRGALYKEVLINRSGDVMGLVEADTWSIVMPRPSLLEILLTFCHVNNVDPKERTYLLELVKAMEFDGVNFP
jgi:hypothetical protein